MRICNSIKPQFLRACFAAAIVGNLNFAIPAANAAEDDSSTKASFFERIRLNGRIELHWQAIEAHVAKQEFSQMAEKLQHIADAEKRLYGHSRAATVRLLAATLERLEEYDRAVKARGEAFELFSRLHGEEHWKTIDARLDLEYAELIGKMDDDQRTRVKQAQALLSKALTLINEGRYQEAVEPTRAAIKIRQELFDKDHRHCLAALSYLAMIHERLGNAGEAQRLYSHLLETGLRQLGPQHPDCATEMNNLAGAKKALGRLDEAVALNRKALRICQQAFGDDDRSCANSLNNLAVNLGEIGQYQEAAQLLEQAASISLKTGGRDKDYAATLGNQAAIYQKMADFPRAEAVYQETIELSRELLGEGHPGYAQLLRNYGTMLTVIGSFSRAEQLLRQAVSIEKTALGAEHPEVAVGMNNLGFFYYELGDYAKADENYSAAANVFRKRQHPMLATALNNLGLLRLREGKPGLAELFFQKSNQIRAATAGTANLEYAQGLLNIAGACGNMGDEERAIRLVEQSLEIMRTTVGEKHVDYANGRRLLADLYLDRDDFAKAKALLEESLQIVEEVVGKQHMNYGITMLNLAQIEGYLGDPAAAVAMSQQAVDVLRQALGQSHPRYLAALSSLGAAHTINGEFPEARRVLDQAYAQQSKLLSAEHPDSLQTVSRIANLLIRQDDREQAEPLLRQILMSQRRRLDATFAFLSQSRQLAMVHKLRSALDQYLVLTLKTTDPASINVAYNAAVAWKGAIFQEQHQLRRLFRHPDLAADFSALRKTTQRLAGLVEMTPTAPQMNEWQQEILRLSEQKDTLEADLTRRSSTLGNIPRFATIDKIRSAVPADATFVDYLVFTEYKFVNENSFVMERSEHLVAFVVRPECPIWMRYLGPMTPISEAVKQWRIELFEGRARQDATDRQSPRQRVRELVWQPLESHLDGATTVLISPDGALTQCPFAALPGQATERYLIEERKLAIIPFAQRLVTLAQQHEPISENDDGNLDLHHLLLVGDVDFDASSSVSRQRHASDPLGSDLLRRPQHHFAALPGTSHEIEALSSLSARLRGKETTKVLRQADATESSFRQHATQSRNLHIATHGYFAQDVTTSALDATRQRRAALTSVVGGDVSDRSQITGRHPGLLSGLALAGANVRSAAHIGSAGDTDDGILTALEVSTLDLQRTDLVVLSACQTGLGKVVGGEGVLGLQRAFEIAGARTTIASLWPVDDHATQVLMERFYRNYWEEQMSKLDSLRETQLWMLNHPLEVWRTDTIAETRGDRRRRPASDEKGSRLPPQFWAAFSLSGDWR